jgi:signal recognition particle subunit SRP54
MMRQMMGGGGMPGMPPIPGMRRTASKSAKKKAKKKPKGGRPGGNPAAGKTGGKPATGPRAGNGAGQGAPAAGQGAGGGLPSSPEELAASLDALNANPALRRAVPDLGKLPSPDGAPGANGPGSLPAGFGLLGRRRQAKKDDQ